MKTSAEIDTLPIEQVRVEFGAIMDEIVTGYGDNIASANTAQPGDQAQEESEDTK